MTELASPGNWSLYTMTELPHLEIGVCTQWQPHLEIRICVP